jgi:Mg2+ and Co2+ transporter CorA
LHPKRNYNRAIPFPEKYSKEKSDLLPRATKKLIRYIMDLTEDGTKQTESDIRAEQENVDGFIDIQQQRKKNMERLTKALSEYDYIKRWMTRYQKYGNCQSSVLYHTNMMMTITGTRLIK